MNNKIPPVEKGTLGWFLNFGAGITRAQAGDAE